MVLVPTQKRCPPAPCVRNGTEWLKYLQSVAVLCADDLRFRIAAILAGIPHSAFDAEKVRRSFAQDPHRCRRVLRPGAVIPQVVAATIRRSVNGQNVLGVTIASVARAQED